jgi:hypothetical protein
MVVNLRCALVETPMLIKKKNRKDNAVLLLA